MAKTPETPAARKKPDGIMTTQINHHTFVVELFFNHDSKETFQDKLLKIMLADKPA